MAIRDALAGVLRTQSQPTEEYKHLIRNDDDGKTQVPGNWYRLYNDAGNLVGVEFCCKCKTIYTFLSAFEWMNDYDCKACSTKVSMLSFIGLNQNSAIQEVFHAVMKLPPRPRIQGASGRPQRTVADTWGGAQDPLVNDVGWDGDKAAEKRADINNGLF